MTTLTIPDLSSQRLGAPVTRFDRALLRAASALDAYAVGRLARRSGADRRRALTAQADADGVRRMAAARGAIGMIPR